jgi:hypothetical protein
VRLLLAAVCMLIAHTTIAHHSSAMFDKQNRIELSGTIERVEWTNPHTWIHLRVEGDNGDDVIWALEYGPINMLSRRGLTRETMQAGDPLVVRVYPVRSGEPIAQLIGRDAFIEGPEMGDIPWQKRVRFDPVEMSDGVARDFNGIWFGADGSNRFESAVSAEDQRAPLTAEYQAKLDKRRADAKRGVLSQDPTAACGSAGYPRILNLVFPSEILQAEHQLNWYVEWNQDTLRIYLDGREPPDDLFPSYTGYTTGAWDGNSIVTRTTHLRGDTLIDTTGIPHSDQLTTTMRMTKITPDFFKADITLYDPVAFTEPWTVEKHYVRAPEKFFVQEYNCAEGNKHRVQEDGTVTIDFE